MKFLIIDDSSEKRDILKIHLRALEQPPEIIEAANGEEGILMIQQNPDLDLIFIDIHMPKKSGLNVLDELTNKVTFETPLIMISSVASEEVLNYSMYGASGYIKFPATKDNVIGEVKKVLGIEDPEESD